MSDEPVPADYFRLPPPQDQVLEFLRCIFVPSSLAPETAVIALVYINRIMAYTNLTLHSSTWKRVVLGAVVLACKVWDDLAVWNVDFCQIFPKVALDNINDLELVYLEMMRFNMNVDSSLYTHCYFELRSLAEEWRCTFSLSPLNADGASRLKMQSAKQQQQAAARKLRACQSLDTLVA